MPEPFDAQELFPWCLQEVMAGRIVALGSVEAAPAPAARDREVWQHFGIKSNLTFPLIAAGGRLIGALSFNTTREERAWPEEIIMRLKLVAEVFAQAIYRKRSEEKLQKSYQEIKLLNDRLQAETEYLRTEIKVNYRHGEIIGESAAIQSVIRQAEQVAHTNSSVLLSGETGVGKDQDADRLDALGAIGIARTFSVGGSEKRPIYNESDPFCHVRKPDDHSWTVDHFYRKLLLLEKKMNTKFAKSLAKKRTKL